MMTNDLAPALGGQPDAKGRIFDLQYERNPPLSYGIDIALTAGLSDEGYQYSHTELNPDGTHSIFLVMTYRGDCSPDIVQIEFGPLAKGPYWLDRTWYLDGVEVEYDSLGYPEMTGLPDEVERWFLVAVAEDG